ncbi:hypothetical protein [Paractinoplanes rishiriensis]|uniref:Uncharacterized protein n=1 Tax=Paractinoplanes rishiriensis TaxID=1050105 RepID=A0A919JPE1_9ACTN|nr:hypothetical protein [Actinoplanes rishiriensis]GIE92716.1 hypothetical protein Ari01nite_01810 [Actinoplanes rishiriensis]
MRDTLERRLAEPEEQLPPRFSRRRLIRWFAVLTFGIVLVIAVWQEPLYARF